MGYKLGTLFNYNRSLCAGSAALPSTFAAWQEPAGRVEYPTYQSCADISALTTWAQHYHIQQSSSATRKLYFFEYTGLTLAGVTLTHSVGVAGTFTTAGHCDTISVSLYHAYDIAGYCLMPVLLIFSLFRLIRFFMLRHKSSSMHHYLRLLKDEAATMETNSRESLAAQDKIEILKDYLATDPAHVQAWNPSRRREAYEVMVFLGVCVYLGHSAYFIYLKSEYSPHSQEEFYANDMACASSHATGAVCNSQLPAEARADVEDLFDTYAAHDIIAIVMIILCFFSTLSVVR